MCSVTRAAYRLRPAAGQDATRESRRTRLLALAIPRGTAVGYGWAVLRAVGFDLDMTLIDTRPVATLIVDQLALEFGVPVSGAQFARQLGPPLSMLLADVGVPSSLIPAMVTRYRELYPSLITPAGLPGADEALAAVRSHGARIVIVSGKHEPNVRLHVQAQRWPADHVAGDLWGVAKGDVLDRQHVDVYVGDHTSDVAGAQAAGAVPVGVATGPCDARQLAAAGAAVVLDSLTEFPRWLAKFVATGSGKT